MKRVFASVIAATALCGAVAQEPVEPAIDPGVGRIPAPVPEPVVPVKVLPPVEETEVKVESSERTLEDNGLYRKVAVTATFTNPNRRQMSWDWCVTIPDDATVCGYSLEINGSMVPGVVTAKEKARVAFESEKAKRVDPGIVEHVAGNVWKTRIFPLLPDTPRKAEVVYIVPVADGEAKCVCEKDREDVFVAERTDAATGAAPTWRDAVSRFQSGTILWDASASAEKCAAQWRARLELLPEDGEWTLVAFRNDAEKVGTVKGRSLLLAAIDGLKYDGGTDIGAAVASLDPGRAPGSVLLFTDEIDTLGVERPRYESDPSVTVASRPDPKPRTVTVRKLKDGEAAPDGVEVKEGTLLATAWAADRIKDLTSQADARKDEFLELGRRYGVASPVTSLIVLENVEQYLEHRIEPPKGSVWYDEWVRRRAAEDDAINDRKKRAEHEKDLLTLWEERVKWWKDPIPPRKTPKSGLFEGIFGERNASPRRALARDGMASPAAYSAGAQPVGVAPAGMSASLRSARAVANDDFMAEDEGGAVAEEAEVAREASPRQAPPNPGAAGSGGATITICAWDPKAPYLDALKAAPEGKAYEEYLNQRKTHGKAPAFYMDAAGWFFKAGESALAVRILSNMAEFQLEDAAIWRSMGWRLREAGEYRLAVTCFRKALAIRTEEGQSRRDLALVLAEEGKELFAKGEKALAKARLEEAMKLFNDAAFQNWPRRSGRRSNDRQVSIISLEELNGLMGWCDAQSWGEGEKPVPPDLDPAYRRDIPVKVRIVLSWDADETDIDIHVLEPEGEEAFYSHRRTGAGGFVGEDVTTGYGPEEYLRKEGTGTFRILTHYYASHQTALTGAATATATVYTDWATAAEKRQILTLRLDKPKSKLPIGTIEIQ